MVSKGLLGGFVADRRGNIATIAALTFSVTLGAAAFGVDIGKLAADKRKLQSAADLAAIVAASNVAKAEAAAVSAAQRNGFDAAAMKLVERGVYTPSAALQAQKRFVPSNGADANAVRVLMSAQSELMFAKLLVGKDRYDIQATATAATTGVATFAIGSRLVSLNGGLLNAILGATLGTNISLSAMDYQALLDARVDAFDFVNALATKAAVTGVTYNDVLAMNVKVGDILSATQASMVGSAAARAALGSIIQSVGGQGGTIVPSTILNSGPYGSLQVGQKPRTAVSLSAYDLVAASARLADGTNQIAASLNCSICRASSGELMATVGEMPKGKSWIAIGTQGASVHTAQTRVYLVLQLAGGSGIASVTLPLYVEVATGTAVLDQTHSRLQRHPIHVGDARSDARHRGRVHRRRSAEPDDRLLPAAGSDACDHREHRAAPRHGQGAGKNGEHGPHESDLQPGGHLGAGEEDGQHDVLYVVAHVEPAQ